MKGESLTFAHTLGVGGPDLELLLLAGGLLVLGVIFFFQKTVKPFVPVVLIAAAFALTAGAFALSGDDPGQSSRNTTEARVTITSPTEGAVVPAGEPLTVQIGLTGGELISGSSNEDPNAGHIHVYWDGQIVSMPSVTDPVVDAELVTPGEHEIIIEFVDVDHYPFDPSVQANVVITAE